MSRLQTEHYYTFRGRQRAVFLRPDAESVVFGLEVQAGDEAAVEVSYDAHEALRKGQGRWELFEGGLGGGLHGATALRVHVAKVDGWVKLMVNQETMNG